MKCPIYEMSIYEMSYIRNVLFIKRPVNKMSIKIISFSKMSQYLYLTILVCQVSCSLCNLDILVLEVIDIPWHLRGRRHLRQVEQTDPWFDGEGTWRFWPKSSTCTHRFSATIWIEVPLVSGRFVNLSTSSNGSSW